MKFRVNSGRVPHSPPGEPAGADVLDWGPLACGAGVTSAVHNLVNVYGPGGLGFGVPWSLARGHPLLFHSGGPVLQAGWGGAWQACANLGSWPGMGWVGGEHSP